MRRDELVDGAYYLVKSPNVIFSVENCEINDGKQYLFGYDFAYLCENGFEWARINPEEIFNSVPANSQDEKELIKRAHDLMDERIATLLATNRIRELDEATWESCMLLRDLCDKHLRGEHTTDVK